MSNPDSVKVSVHDGTVTIELPLELVRERLGARKRRRRPGSNWAILKTTRGMWRRRKIDGLAYQREVRQGWDRRTPQ